MKQYLGGLSLLVRDYDEAISYYTQKLGFELLQDTDLGAGKRWVQVAPRGSECRLLLAQARSESELRALGQQAGGRVFLFLHTDDFERDYQRMLGQGVKFLEAPRSEVYGKVVVFEDLYGNQWDLIQTK